MAVDHGAALWELTQTHPALSHGGSLGAQNLPGRVFVNKREENGAGPLPCCQRGWMSLWKKCHSQRVSQRISKIFFVEYPWLSGAIQTFLKFGNRHLILWVFWLLWFPSAVPGTFSLAVPFGWQRVMRQQELSNS